jgi:mRNA interferase RelE/StbE
MYDIEFTEDAKRQFLKLDKSIQERIGSVLERVRILPEHFVEKLVGEPGYKLRVGDYRVILDIINQDLIILVLEVSHRKNIYKKR